MTCTLFRVIFLKILFSPIKIVNVCKKKNRFDYDISFAVTFVTFMWLFKYEKIAFTT